jgi:hypothetical protein
VVCDEPTSAQDPATIGPVMGALLNCEFDPAPGRPPVKSTVIAITHNVVRPLMCVPVHYYIHSG